MEAVVRIESASHAAAGEFLERSWAPGHAYTLSPELYNWTFGRTELWDLPDPTTAYLAYSDDRSIGFLGGVPFEMNHFGEKSLGTWLMNWIVEPAHRNGEAGFGLMGKFRRSPYDCTISFGINARVAQLYKMWKWTVVDRIPRYVFINPSRLLEAAEMLRPFNEGLVLSGAPAVLKASMETVAGLPDAEVWDRSVWPAIAAVSIGASRNSAYLTWRYALHPIYRYRFISCEGGLLVWRLERCLRQVGDSYELIGRMGRVVELMFTNEAAGRALVARFVEDLESAGAFAADFFGYHGPTLQLLGSAGFMEQQDLGYVFPNYARPFGGSGEIMSAVGMEGLTSVDSSWIWTRADSDQDRPNLLLGDDE